MGDLFHTIALFPSQGNFWVIQEQLDLGLQIVDDQRESSVVFAFSIRQFLRNIFCSVDD